MKKPKTAFFSSTNGLTCIKREKTHFWLAFLLNVLGGVEELMQKFIEKHKHSDFNLSIFDSMTNRTIEIDCGLDEMPTIVDYNYHLEKGTPLTFIGVNSMSGSYVVGMTISRGRIDFGCYKAENGKLVKL